MNEKLHDMMDSIREKGLGRLSEFFEMDDADVSKRDPELVKIKRAQANMALKLNRDMTLDSRAATGHKIRIAALVTENKQELKNILKNGVQKYIE